MRWPPRSLTMRQVLVGQFLLVVLLASVLVAVLVTFWRLPAIQAQAETEQRRAAGSAAHYVGVNLQYAEQLALALAHVLQVTAPVQDKQRAAFNRLLTQLAEQADFFQVIYRLDDQARIRELFANRAIAPHLGEWLGNDLSGLAIWRQVSQTGRPQWSDQYRSPVLDAPVVSFMVPVNDGYLLMELGVEQLAQAVRQSSVLEGLVVIVTDSKGEVVAAPDREWVNWRRNISQWPLVAAALRGESRHDHFEFGGASYIGTTVRLEPLGWVVLAGYPGALMRQSHDYAVRITAATLLASVAFGLLLLLGFSRFINRRLQGSLNFAAQVAKGNYQAKLVKTGVAELDALSQGLEQMAHTIRNRQAQLQAIIETTPSLAIQWFDRDGRVVDWNAASEQVLGWTRAEALGKTLEQLIYTPQQGLEFLQVLRDIEHTGQPFGPYEGAILRRLERPAWILSTTFSIPNLQGGSWFVCMDVDITELKRKEQAVRESEEKFNLFFQASPVAVAVLQETESGYLYVDVNPAWLELLGYQREALIGADASLHEAIVDDHLLRDVFARLKAAGELRSQPGRLRTRSGAVLQVEAYMRLVSFQGQNLLICSMLDITDKRAMEKALRQLNAELEERIALRTQKLSETVEHLKNAQTQLVQSEKLASLGALVAGVAHELNTPIGNGMMSVSTLAHKLRLFRDKLATGLRKSDLDAFVEQVELAADIALRNMQRASELITSFKQVAVDQTSSQRRSFGLAAVLQEVALTLQPMLKHTPIGLTLDVPAGIELDSYPGPLGQVVTNLIQNAVIHAFADQQPGQVELLARSRDDGAVEVLVRDNGSGIPPDLLDRVFDPFFTTRLGKGGSGLGLHIAHNIVTGVLGGQISVRNRPSGGAEFTLVFPRRAPGL